MSTAVHGAQVMGGMQKNHTTRVKRPLGLWNRISLAYGPFGGTNSDHVLDCPCPGMVLTVCSRAALRHNAVSPTHPESHRGNRGNKESKQAEKQAG